MKMLKIIYTFIKQVYGQSEHITPLKAWEDVQYAKNNLIKIVRK